MADDLLNLELPDFGDFSKATKPSGSGVNDLALPDLPEFNLNMPAMPDIRNIDTITFIDSNDHTSSDYFTNPHGYEEDMNEALSISSDSYEITDENENKTGNPDEEKKNEEDNEKLNKDENKDENANENKDNQVEDAKSHKSNASNKDNKSLGSKKSHSSRKSKSKSAQNTIDGGSVRSKHKDRELHTEDAGSRISKLSYTSDFESLSVDQVSTAGESLLNLDKNSNLSIDPDFANRVKGLDSISLLLIDDDALTDNPDPLHISDYSSPDSMESEPTSVLAQPIKVDDDKLTKKYEPDFTEDEKLKERLEKITDPHALEILNRLRHDAIKRAEVLAEEKTEIEELRRKCKIQEYEFYKMHEKADSIDEEDSISAKIAKADVTKLKRYKMIREDEIEDAMDELEDLERQNSYLDVTIKDKDALISVLEHQKLGRYEMENTIPILNDEHERLRKEQEEISKKYKKVKEKCKAIVDRHAELCVQLDNLKKAEKEREHALMQIDPEKERLTEIEAKVKAMKKTNAQLKKTMTSQLSESELKRIIPQVRLVIRTKEAIIKNMMRRVETHNEDIENLKAKIAEMEKETNDAPQPFPVVPPLYPPMTPSKEIMDHLAQPLYSRSDIENQKPPMTEPKRRRN